MKKIAAIVNFCSNEKRFIKPFLEEIHKAVDTVIVPICDHFFDGKKEDVQSLQEIFRSFPKTQFFLYPFLPKLFPRKERTHFLHNVSRLIGFEHLPKDVDYVLFLDVDEIVDGKRLKEWFQSKSHEDYDFLKLFCYWYFREPSFRAKSFETSPLLIKRSCLSKDLIMQKDERSGMYTQGVGTKIEGIFGLDQKPMVHHYSWVRSREEMLKKVLSWGHASDRDWRALIEKEFSAPFSGTDFIHGYEYETIEPFVSLDETIYCSATKEDLTVLSKKDLTKIVKGKRPSFLKYFFPSKKP